MTELSGEAIVLGKEDLSEQDSRVFLYVKDRGRITAKVTSARKITSKLAAHLEPLNYLTVRLISKKDAWNERGFQLTDALLIKSPTFSRLEADWFRKAVLVFDLMAKMLPEGVYDEELWQALFDILDQKLMPDLRGALKILGFDSVFSRCELCSKNSPEYFLPVSNFFVCRSCSPFSKKSSNDFILIQ